MNYIGIEPEGNLWLTRAGAQNVRGPGLGHMQVLPDGLMLEILDLLGPTDLAHLACTSKSCYVFSDHDELWKKHCMEEFGGAFTWSLTWRDSYVATKHPLHHTSLQLTSTLPTTTLYPSSHASASRTGAPSNGTDSIPTHSLNKDGVKETAGTANVLVKGGGTPRSKRARRSGSTDIAAAATANGEGLATAGPGRQQLRSGPQQVEVEAPQGDETAVTGAAVAEGKAVRPQNKRGRGRQASAVQEQPASGGGGCDKDGQQEKVASQVQEYVQACAPASQLKICRALNLSGCFFSDLLYQPWHCATVQLAPEWLEVDNITRCSGLSRQEFMERFEMPGLPVLLTDAATSWPALQKWSLEQLMEAYGDRPIIAGNQSMPVKTYAAYASSTCDEMPLSLFDKDFVVNAPSLAEDFQVPEVFTEDLFSVLGDARPDYRWLIVGPARSGSSFHIDPNATHAWNAVVTGAKKWILYPPSCVPPGVHPSADGANVATPVSLIEWFVNWYDVTRESKVRPVECIVRPGECIFVPAGWWHTALNLESMTIAVTQNFTSSANLESVLALLATGRKDLVSGCAQDDRGSLHDRFVSGLEKQHPDLLADVQAKQEAKRHKLAEEARLARLFHKTDGPSKKVEGVSQGFSFGFSFGA